MYTHFANQCEGASPLSVDMKKCIQLQQKIQKKMLVWWPCHACYSWDNLSNVNFLEVDRDRICNVYLRLSNSHEIILIYKTFDGTGLIFLVILSSIEYVACDNLMMQLLRGTADDTLDLCRQTACKLLNKDGMSVIIFQNVKIHIGQEF